MVKINDITKLLINHINQYPLVQIQDIVKFLYQGEFGPKHMIGTENKSFQFLKDEYKSIDDCLETIMSENLGNDLVRLHLNSLDQNMISLVNKFFIQTAHNMQGDIEVFKSKLRLFKDMCRDDALPFHALEVDNYLKRYQEEGYRAIHHSDIFKKSYHPSYRVIDNNYLSTLNIIKQINHLLKQKEHIVIAIDGSCASGKTTLAKTLSEIYESNIIHMDDFYLPSELRTKERRSEAGGNIHYERFFEEVIEALRKHIPMIYRKFDCHTMGYIETIALKNKPVTIIEGSYSMRKEFRPVYDYSIFSTCDYDTQLKRILKRNGEECLQSFISTWIPLENRYFDTLNIQDYCDVIVDTSC